MLDPALIQSQAGLTEPPAPLLPPEEKLHLRFTRSFGFDFHWLREEASAAFGGELGLRIQTGAEARIDLRLGGSFRKVESVDGRGRLRLKIYKADGGFNFASHVSATARALTPPPEGIDELAAAVLGVHPLVWLKELSLGFDDLPPRFRKVLPPIPPEDYRRFFEQWNALGPGEAAAVWGDSDGWTGAAILRALKDYALRRVCPEAVERGLSRPASFDELDAWVKKQLGKVFGRMRSAADFAAGRDGLRTVLRFRSSVYDKAVAALETKCAAEASRLYQSATPNRALLDCSFDFTDEGLDLYRAALAGDYSRLANRGTPGGEIRGGVLAGDLLRPAYLELHLPFLRPKAWNRRLKALRQATVESDESGRLVVRTEAAEHTSTYQSTLALAGGMPPGPVHSTASFTLGFADRRRLPAARLGGMLDPVLRGYGFDDRAARWLNRAVCRTGRKVELSVSLSTPGTLAAAWPHAPSERPETYFRVYAGVSMAVQRALRRWLPLIYFEDLDRYGLYPSAHSLLVYSGSRPFAGEWKDNFTYDALNPASMDLFFETAARGGFQRELTRVHRVLKAYGKDKTARHYDPNYAAKILSWVRREPRLVHGLLVAETAFVNAFITFGCKASRVKRMQSADRLKANKELLNTSSGLVKSLHSWLKRLFGTLDFTPLGQLLLVEATSAVASRLKVGSGIRAVLRLSGPEGFEQVLVNSATRRYTKNAEIFF